MRVEQFKVIVELRERAHCGASGADGVFLLNGDGGGYALDTVHRRLVHAIEELTHIG